MLQMIVCFGSGAVSYLTAEALSGKRAKSWYRALIQWFAYSVWVQFFALLILIPLNKAAIVTAESGMQTVQMYLPGYGVVLAAAVFFGIAAAIVKKRIQVQIEITSEKSETTDEKEKSS